MHHGLDTGLALCAVKVQASCVVRPSAHGCGHGRLGASRCPGQGQDQRARVSAPGSSPLITARHRCMLAWSGGANVSPAVWHLCIETGAAGAGCFGSGGRRARAKAAAPTNSGRASAGGEQRSARCGGLPRPAPGPAPAGQAGHGPEHHAVHQPAALPVLPARPLAVRKPAARRGHIPEPAVRALPGCLCSPLGRCSCARCHTMHKRGWTGLPGHCALSKQGISADEV
jgi:hypothetical protein